MRADEYVVAELQKAKQQADELKVANSVLRNDYFDLKTKYDYIVSLFKVEPMKTSKGYVITIKGSEDFIPKGFEYAWTDKVEDFSPAFKTLLNALGFELPKIEQPETQEKVEESESK